MSNIETDWYELIGSQKIKGTLISCDFYASAFGVKDIENVVFKCAAPIIKGRFCVYDREKNEVASLSHDFDKNGVLEFVLKDAFCLDEIKKYETSDAKYNVQLYLTLISGDEIEGWFTLQGNLITGNATKDLEKYDFLDKLNAIPIAQPGMSEDELRKICLDYMTLQNEFTYKLKEDFDYVVVSQNRERKLKAGNVYAGIPYITRGAGNLYRIAEFYDEKTGEIDTSGDIFQNIRHFGNACSGSACTSWARVITSAYLGYTMFLTEANGFLPVGPYKYSKDNVTRFIKTKYFSDGYDCKSICDENGEQNMFESYALMKPADGVGCCGHVRMNSAVPTVVRNADGTIDGERSYTLMTEQVCYVSNPNHMRIASDGTHYTAQGFVNIKYSFCDLFKTNYIPFTFAEFKNPELVEKVKIRLSVEPELKMEVLSANYPISDVFCELSGKRYVFRNEEFFRKELKLSDIFPEHILTREAKITCRLYNGGTYEVDTRGARKK